MAGESAIKLDENGDFYVENNKLILIGGSEAIQQHLTNRLYFFFGEWFLNIDLGVPWFRDILIKNPSFPLISSILKQVILDTPGVTELLQFDMSYVETRTLSLEFKADTDTGPIDFSTLVEI